MAGMRKGRIGAEKQKRLMVFLQPAIFHLVEAGDALQDTKWMFYFRPYSRLTPVLFPL